MITNMGNYRNGTYVAFDGQGETNPINSDLHNFELLKAWQKSDEVNFNFVNSHEKNYNVKDTSSLATLKARLRERMANSKNMLVIVSCQTNKHRGLLNWEIELAVEEYRLPIIVAYVDPAIEYIGFNFRNYIQWMPSKLREYIYNDAANIAHIPFNASKISRAINHYSIVTKTMPADSMEFF